MYKYKTEPFKHQRRSLVEGAKPYNFAYFMEMGTGKTKVAIDNAAYLYQDKRIDFAFVIAPNSVYQNWKKEIDVHCPEDTNIYIWKVSKDKTFRMDPDKLTFVLMNVEALSHASGKKWLESKLQKHGMRSMIILDESTSIKNLKASRTKSIIKLGQFAFDFVDDEISDPLKKWLNSSSCNFEFTNFIESLPDKIMLDDAREAFRIIQANEIWNLFGPWIEKTDPIFGPGVKERMNIAKTVSNSEKEEKLNYKVRVKNAFNALVPKGSIMALPVTASLPAKLNTDPAKLNSYRAKTLSIICLASLAGLPQISIPVTNTNGIPVSLGLLGWEGGDEALIEFAESIAV